MQPPELADREPAKTVVHPGEARTHERILNDQHIPQKDDAAHFAPVALALLRRHDLHGLAVEDAGRRLSGINEGAPTAGEIVGRLAETTVQTVESTVLLAGFGGINRGVYQHRRARKLEDLQDTQERTLDTVAGAVQNSPVMKDMPGTGEALLEHLAEGGVLPKQVFIRPEAVQQTFFQTEDPERMAAAADMGITPESLEENLTLGTDVAVDMSKASAHILKDAELYAALKPDMRLSPDMFTDAEVEDLAAMNADAQARLDYLNDILAPHSEEVADAENRYQQRMEIAEPYMEQWRAAGYTENQAEAFGLVLAASAERMAPPFGKTPQEYLEERLAGYFGMTQEEFENLHEGGLDALFENRETAALLQEMGVRRGMSHNARRRALQPEFAYVYGKVSPESVQNLYGMERYKELRRQFGPGFFAKKGEGVHIDVLAHGFMSEERGAYDQNRDSVDVDEFAEKVFMPHDEFEGGIGSLLRGGTLWQEQTAEEKLAQDVAAWEQQVDALEKGSLNMFAEMTMLTQTPLVMQLVGAKDLPVKIAPGKLKKAMAKHGLSFDVIRQIPAALADPIMIFASATQGGDLVMMLDIRDSAQNGATVNVPIALSLTDAGGYEAHIATTAFGRRKNSNGAPDNQWFVRQIEQGNLLYRNNKKSRDWARTSRVQFPDANSRTITAGKKLVTDADLVKLRQKKPTYYQNQKPIEVSSAALGVPEGSSIREYRDAAKKFHDRLREESKHGKPVIQPDLARPVRFSRTGWGKNKDAGADYRKWQLFPFLREIIESSRLVKSNQTTDRTDGFVSTHWLESEVILDGQPLLVGIRLLEDVNGNLFYNLWTDASKAKEKSPSQLETKNQTLGHEGLHQDEASPGENKITPDTDGVNLHIFESRATGRAQGAIRPLEDGRYVVGLFKSKNASTVLHETAHFWLEELRRAAGLETAPEWVREAWARLEQAYGFEGAALTPEKWREVQERFAREFEAYARDGKAPSWELQTAFSRFRNWLSDIYRSIKAILGVHEVSPEVREVFDALLATDEEIEQSRRAVERGSVMEELGEEVAPELRDRYARAVQKAHENASAVIANRRLVDRRKAERDFR